MATKYCNLWAWYELAEQEWQGNEAGNYDEEVDHQGADGRDNYNWPEWHAWNYAADIPIPDEENWDQEEAQGGNYETRS